jgi:AraC-like DNA-binding protein
VVFSKGSGVTHTYPRHWHDEIHFCSYDAGYGHLQCRGRSYVVGEGDLVVTPPGEVHENWVDSADGIGFVGAYVDMPTLCGCLRQIVEGDPSLPEFSELIVADAGVHRSFRRLCFAENGLSQEESLLEFLSGLISKCVSVTRLKERVGEEPSAVRITREYIDEHFQKTISLAELGRLTGLSTFHLHRVFCRQTGMPPHAYQTQRRINRAKQLLREMRSLSEVALLTGFADQSHFTRHFRRLVGVTPGRFAA